LFSQVGEGNKIQAKGLREKRGGYQGKGGFLKRKISRADAGGELWELRI